VYKDASEVVNPEPHAFIGDLPQLFYIQHVIYDLNIPSGSYKRPKICNDVVLLNDRIQTKENNIFKEQS